MRHTDESTEAATVALAQLKQLARPKKDEAKFVAQGTQAAVEVAYPLLPDWYFPTGQAMNSQPGVLPLQDIVFSHKPAGRDDMRLSFPFCCPV